MVKPTATKPSPRFPTMIRDPKQVVSIVKKDLVWIAVASGAAVAMALIAYLLIKPA